MFLMDLPLRNNRKGEQTRSFLRSLFWSHAVVEIMLMGKCANPSESLGTTTDCLCTQGSRRSDALLLSAEYWNSIILILTRIDVSSKCLHPRLLDVDVAELDDRDSVSEPHATKSRLR